MRTIASRTSRGFALLAAATLGFGLAACVTEMYEPAPMSDTASASPQQRLDAERTNGEQSDFGNATSGSVGTTLSGGPAPAPAPGAAPAPQPTPPPVGIPDEVPPGVGYPPEGPGCQIDPQSPTIYEAVPQLPATPDTGSYWQYRGNSNFSPCLRLSYAQVEQMPQGDGQFPTQLMLFHNGHYIGIGTTSTQHGTIVAHDGMSVTVSYTDYEALDRDGAPFAEAGRYQVQVTYRWNEQQQRVIPEGRIPNLN